MSSIKEKLKEKLQPGENLEGRGGEGALQLLEEGHGAGLRERVSELERELKEAQVGCGGRGGEGLRLKGQTGGPGSFYLYTL